MATNFSNGGSASKMSYILYASQFGIGVSVKLVRFYIEQYIIKHRKAD